MAGGGLGGGNAKGSKAKEGGGRRRQHRWQRFFIPHAAPHTTRQRAKPCAPEFTPPPLTRNSRGIPPLLRKVAPLCAL
eukprot:8691244-Pyramimonas_sp.AAC.1